MLMSTLLIPLVQFCIMLCMIFVYVLKLLFVGLGGYPEATRNDIWEHDCSYVCLFWTIHEVCMDGSTSELPSPSLSCFERISSTLSAISLGKSSRVFGKQRTRSAEVAAEK